MLMNVNVMFSDLLINLFLIKSVVMKLVSIKYV